MNLLSLDVVFKFNVFKSLEGNVRYYFFSNVNDDFTADVIV
jgi:hypothetical protein